WARRQLHSSSSWPAGAKLPIRLGLEHHRLRIPPSKAQLLPLPPRPRRQRVSSPVSVAGFGWRRSSTRRLSRVGCGSSSGGGGGGGGLLTDGARLSSVGRHPRLTAAPLLSGLVNLVEVFQVVVEIVRILRNRQSLRRARRRRRRRLRPLLCRSSSLLADGRSSKSTAGLAGVDRCSLTASSPGLPSTQRQSMAQFADTAAAICLSLGQNSDDASRLCDLIDCAMESLSEVHQFRATRAQLSQLSMAESPFVITAAIGQELESRGLHKQAATCDEAGQCRAHGNLGAARLLQGDRSAAMRHERQRLRLAAGLGLDETPRPPVRRGRRPGWRAGQPPSMCRYLARRWAAVGAQAAELGSIGCLHRQLGRPAEAASWHREQLRLAEAAGSAGERARALINLGEDAMAAGQPDEAAEHLAEALAAAEAADG
uniref:TPR_REGION domain-containing protein n=1 Tax=Macrostomum lignano TaxID=282301 RepID=A0A1I8F9K0_9PLAT